MKPSSWTAVLLLAVAAGVSAQVPLSQEPRHHVVFENKLFRVLNVDVPPGDTTLDHRHDRDLVTVSVTNGTETRIQPTGQAWQTRPPRPLGDVVINDYEGKPQSHRLETTGKTAYQLFAVEHVGGTRSTGPALKAEGTKMTAESRSFRVFDVQLGRERSQTTHTHAVPTIALLLDGKVMSEGPDTHAKENAPAAVGLKQLDRPGQWVLVPAGDTHHLVRLASADARIIEIEVR
jgi:quercetin dioxygenase-like cupin family protein